MPRPQFSLRALFVLTALVAVGSLVVPRAVAWHHRRQRIELVRAELDHLYDSLPRVRCGMAFASYNAEIKRLEKELTDLGCRQPDRLAIVDEENEDEALVVVEAAPPTAAPRTD